MFTASAIFTLSIHMSGTITTVFAHTTRYCRLMYQRFQRQTQDCSYGRWPNMYSLTAWVFLFTSIPSSYDGDLSCLVSCIIGRFWRRLGIGCLFWGLESGCVGMGSASLGLWYYGLGSGRWVYTTVIKFKSLVRNVCHCIPRLDHDVIVNVGINIAIDVGPPCTVVTHVTHIICKLPFLHMHTAHAPCIPGRLLPRLHVCHRYCLPPAPAL